MKNITNKIKTKKKEKLKIKKKNKDIKKDKISISKDKNKLNENDNENKNENTDKKLIKKELNIETINNKNIDNNESNILQYDKDPYLLKEAKYIEKNKLWRNKQRVLIVPSYLKRKKCKSFIDNLILLIPHHKLETKWNKKTHKYQLKEISESRNCNNIIFFDVKRKNFFLWITKINAVSLYFQLLDYIPMHSLMFSGNALLYSRPLLIFNQIFDNLPHLKLIKEILIHIFGIPNYYPSSKPFNDHCYYFLCVNDIIFFRHYQILPDKLINMNNVKKQKLVEIGPRFSLRIIKIFDNFFKGNILYQNIKNINYLTSKEIKLKEKIEKKIKKMKKKENRTERINKLPKTIKSELDI